MKREVIRVEPLSSYLAKWNAPLSPVTRGSGMVFVSGFPPFDPATGEIIVSAPIERQTEIVLEQMKLCLETAGTSLQNVTKCNIYCASAKHFAAVNAIYARYFPVDPPAFRNAVFDALWQQQRDISDWNVLAECLARAGTDPDLARRAATSEAREALAEDTRRAYANGIFGVPTFVCNDELFFGNDRLDMLAWRLGSGGLAQRNPPVSLP